MRKFAIVLVLVAILALSLVMPAFGGMAKGMTPPGLHKAPAVGNVNPHVVCARCHVVTTLPAALCARCHS